MCAAASQPATPAVHCRPMAGPARPGLVWPLLAAVLSTLRAGLVECGVSGASRRARATRADARSARDERTYLLCYRVVRVRLFCASRKRIRPCRTHSLQPDRRPAWARSATLVHSGAAAAPRTMNPAGGEGPSRAKPGRPPLSRRAKAGSGMPAHPHSPDAVAVACFAGEERRRPGLRCRETCFTSRSQSGVW